MQSESKGIQLQRLVLPCFFSYTDPQCTHPLQSQNRLFCILDLHPLKYYEQPSHGELSEIERMNVHAQNSTRYTGPNTGGNIVEAGLLLEIKQNSNRIIPPKMPVNCIHASGIQSLTRRRCHQKLQL